MRRFFNFVIYGEKNIDIYIGGYRSMAAGVLFGEKHNAEKGIHRNKIPAR